jgi:hypothetical protein
LSLVSPPSDLASSSVCPADSAARAWSASWRRNRAHAVRRGGQIAGGENALAGDCLALLGS